MIIKENELGTSLNEATAFLNNSEYLTEAESAYYPAMVPVRENKRLGLNIIRLEDLVEYAMDNGITDGGYAISSVCEASGIDPASVGFSVDEVSILEDTEMAETAAEMIQAGAPVYAAPLPSTDMAYVMAEACLNSMVECIEHYGDCDAGDVYLEAFINDDFESLANDDLFLESIKSDLKDIGNAAPGIAKTAFARGVHDGIPKAKALAGKAGAKAQSVLEKIKQTMAKATSKPRAWIAKKIAAFNSLLNTWDGRAQYAPPDTRSLFQKVKDKIIECIQFLKDQLAKFGAKIGFGSKEYGIGTMKTSPAAAQ